jgi:hypothetical protein
MENVVAFEIAAAVIEKFGSGSLGSLIESIQTMHDRTSRHLETWPPSANSVNTTKAEGVAVRSSVLEQARRGSSGQND